MSPAPAEPSQNGTLSELTSSSRRLALVGLAKNTGKTVALAALLREASAVGRRIGVTSVGRDGEEHDVIDARIAKPRIHLVGGSLVATTDELLRASGLPHDLLERTGIRTPLGEVLIARLRGGGVIEVAGPSASGQVRTVSDAMLDHGAEQVLIDGAIDRRAASSPDVADGLVMSTGAVLGEDIDAVVMHTKAAVELVRLPIVDETPVTGGNLRAVLAAATARRENLLVSAHGEPVALPPRFALTSEGTQIAAALDANQDAAWLIVEGALPERFLRELHTVARRRARRLSVLVADPTRVFLDIHGVDWYRRVGIDVQALRITELHALTVNPVAPRAHRFDSRELQMRLKDGLPEVPIFDVMSPEYPDTEGAQDSTELAQPPAHT